jgi:DNA polymerase III sliding clamp (beta) subunit (PCNA family)
MSEFSGDEAKISAESCKSRYSLEYLQKFIKGAKLSEKTVLKFANDHPLRIDIKNDFMDLSFLLAPRVENEDD